MENYKKMQIYKDHITRPSKDVPSKFTKYNFLQSHFEYDFSSEMSRRMAQEFIKKIKSRRKVYRETPLFADTVRNDVLYLHKYNLTVFKVAQSYPLSDEYSQLLLQYVLLECKILYKREYYSKDFENKTQNRVLRLLSNVFNDYYECDLMSRKEIIGRSTLSIIEILVKIKTVFNRNYTILENMTTVLIKRIGLLEKINALKGKNISCLMETWLPTDPAVSTVQKNGITSDYGTDDGCSNGPPICIIDDNDMVTDNQTTENNSNDCEIKNEDLYPATRNDGNSTKKTDKLVYTICLDESGLESDEEVVYLAKEVETKKHLNQKIENSESDPKNFQNKSDLKSIKSKRKPLLNMTEGDDILTQLDYILSSQFNTKKMQTKDNTNNTLNQDTDVQVLDDSDDIILVDEDIIEDNKCKRNKSKNKKDDSNPVVILVSSYQVIDMDSIDEKNKNLQPTNRISLLSDSSLTSTDSSVVDTFNSDSNADLNNIDQTETTNVSNFELSSITSEADTDTLTDETNSKSCKDVRITLFKCTDSTSKTFFRETVTEEYNRQENLQDQEIVSDSCKFQNISNDKQNITADIVTIDEDKEVYVSEPCDQEITTKLGETKEVIAEKESSENEETENIISSLEKLLEPDILPVESTYENNKIKQTSNDQEQKISDETLISSFDIDQTEPANKIEKINLMESDCDNITTSDIPLEAEISNITNDTEINKCSDNNKEISNVNCPETSEETETGDSENTTKELHIKDIRINLFRYTENSQQFKELEVQTSLTETIQSHNEEQTVDEISENTIGYLNDETQNIDKHIDDNESVEQEDENDSNKKNTEEILSPDNSTNNKTIISVEMASTPTLIHEDVPEESPKEESVSNDIKSSNEIQKNDNNNINEHVQETVQSSIENQIIEFDKNEENLQNIDIEPDKHDPVEIIKKSDDKIEPQTNLLSDIEEITNILENIPSISETETCHLASDNENNVESMCESESDNLKCSEAEKDLFCKDIRINLCRYVENVSKATEVTDTQTLKEDEEEKIIKATNENIQEHVSDISESNVNTEELQLIHKEKDEYTSSETEKDSLNNNCDSTKEKSPETEDDTNHKIQDMSNLIRERQYSLRSYCEFEEKYLPNLNQSSHDQMRTSSPKTIVKSKEENIEDLRKAHTLLIDKKDDKIQIQQTSEENQAENLKLNSENLDFHGKIAHVSKTIFNTNTPIKSIELAKPTIYDLQEIETQILNNEHIILTDKENVTDAHSVQDNKENSDEQNQILITHHEEHVKINIHESIKVTEEDKDYEEKTTNSEEISENLITSNDASVEQFISQENVQNNVIQEDITTEENKNINTQRENKITEQDNITENQEFVYNDQVSDQIIEMINECSTPTSSFINEIIMEDEDEEEDISLEVARGTAQQNFNYDKDNSPPSPQLLPDSSEDIVITELEPYNNKEQTIGEDINQMQSFQSVENYESSEETLISSSTKNNFESVLQKNDLIFNNSAPTVQYLTDPSSTNDKTFSDYFLKREKYNSKEFRVSEKLEEESESSSRSGDTDWNIYKKKVTTEPCEDLHLLASTAVNIINQTSESPTVSSLKKRPGRRSKAIKKILRLESKKMKTVKLSKRKLRKTVNSTETLEATDVEKRVTRSTYRNNEFDSIMKPQEFKNTLPTDNVKIHQLPSSVSNKESSDSDSNDSECNKLFIDYNKDEESENDIYNADTLDENFEFCYEPRVSFIDLNDSNLDAPKTKTKADIKYYDNNLNPYVSIARLEVENNNDPEKTEISEKNEHIAICKAETVNNNNFTPKIDENTEIVQSKVENLFTLTTKDSLNYSTLPKLRYKLACKNTVKLTAEKLEKRLMKEEQKPFSDLEPFEIKESFENILKNTSSPDNENIDDIPLNLRLKWFKEFKNDEASTASRTEFIENITTTKIDPITVNDNEAIALSVNSNSNIQENTSQIPIESENKSNISDYKKITILSDVVISPKKTNNIHQSNLIADVKNNIENKSEIVSISNDDAHLSNKTNFIEESTKHISRKHKSKDFPEQIKLDQPEINATAKNLRSIKEKSNNDTILSVNKRKIEEETQLENVDAKIVKKIKKDSSNKRKNEDTEDFNISKTDMESNNQKSEDVQAVETPKKSFTFDKDEIVKLIEKYTNSNETKSKKSSRRKTLNEESSDNVKRLNRRLSFSKKTTNTTTSTSSRITRSKSCTSETETFISLSKKKSRSKSVTESKKFIETDKGKDTSKIYSDHKEYKSTSVSKLKEDIINKDKKIIKSSTVTEEKEITKTSTVNVPKNSVTKNKKKRRENFDEKPEGTFTSNIKNIDEKEFFRENIETLKTNTTEKTTSNNNSEIVIDDDSSKKQSLIENKEKSDNKKRKNNLNEEKQLKEPDGQVKLTRSKRQNTVVCDATKSLAVEDNSDVTNIPQLDNTITEAKKIITEKEDIAEECKLSNISSEMPSTTKNQIPQEKSGSSRHRKYKKHFTWPLQTLDLVLNQRYLKPKKCYYNSKLKSLHKKYYPISMENRKYATKLLLKRSNLQKDKRNIYKQTNRTKNVNKLRSHQIKKKLMKKKIKHAPIKKCTKVNLDNNSKRSQLNSIKSVSEVTSSQKDIAEIKFTRNKSKTSNKKSKLSENNKITELKNSNNLTLQTERRVYDKSKPLEKNDSIINTNLTRIENTDNQNIPSKSIETFIDNVPSKINKRKTKKRNKKSDVLENQPVDTTITEKKLEKLEHIFKLNEASIEPIEAKNKTRSSAICDSTKSKLLNYTKHETNLKDKEMECDLKINNIETSDTIVSENLKEKEFSKGTVLIKKSINLTEDESIDNNKQTSTKIFEENKHTLIRVVRNVSNDISTLNKDVTNLLSDLPTNLQMLEVKEDKKTDSANEKVVTRKTKSKVASNKNLLNKNSISNEKLPVETIPKKIEANNKADDAVTDESNLAIESSEKDMKNVPDQIKDYDKLIDVPIKTSQRKNKIKADTNKKIALTDTLNKEIKLYDNSLPIKHHVLEDVIPDEVTATKELLNVAVETRQAKNKAKAKFSKKSTLTDSINKDNAPTEQKTKIDNSSSLTEKQLVENMQDILDEVTPKEKVLDVLVETRRAKSKVKANKKPILIDTVNKDNITLEKETKIDNSSLIENQSIDNVMKAIPAGVIQTEKLLDLSVLTRQTNNKDEANFSQKYTLTDKGNKDNTTLEEETKVASTSLLENAIVDQLSQKEELLDAAVETRQTRNKAKFCKKPLLIATVTEDIVPTEEEKKIDISSFTEKQSVENMQDIPDKAAPKEKVSDMLVETRRTKNKVKYSKKTTLIYSLNKVNITLENEMNINNSSLTETHLIKKVMQAIPNEVTQTEKLSNLSVATRQTRNKARTNISEKDTLTDTIHIDNISLEEVTKVHNFSSLEKAIPNEVTPKEKLLDITLETRDTKSKAKAKFSKKPTLADTVTKDNLPTEQETKMDDIGTVAEKQSVENMQAISDELTPKEELLDVAVETRPTKNKAKFSKKPTEQETKINNTSSLKEKQSVENIILAIPDELTPKEKVLDVLVETRRVKSKVKAIKKPILTDAVNKDNITFKKETKEDDNSLTENQSIEKIMETIPAEVTQTEKLLDLSVTTRQSKNKSKANFSQKDTLSNTGNNDNIILKVETKVENISSLEKAIPGEITPKEKLLDVTVETGHTKSKAKAKFSKKPTLEDTVTKDNILTKQEKTIDNISTLTEKQSAENIQAISDELIPKEELLDVAVETRQTKNKAKANLSQKDTLTDTGNKDHIILKGETTVKNISSLEKALPDEVTTTEKLLDVAVETRHTKSKAKAKFSKKSTLADTVSKDNLSTEQETKMDDIGTLAEKQSVENMQAISDKLTPKEKLLDVAVETRQTNKAKANFSQKDTLTDTGNKDHITLEEETKAESISSLEQAIPDEVTPTEKLLNVTVETRDSKTKAKAKFSKKPTLTDRVTKDNLPTEQETKMAQKQLVQNTQAISEELTPKDQLLDVAVETRQTKNKAKAKFSRKPTEQETKINNTSSLSEKQLVENIILAIPDEVTPKEKVLDVLVETRLAKSKVKVSKKLIITDTNNTDNITLENETKVDNSSLIENQSIDKIMKAIPAEVIQTEKLLDLPVTTRQSKNKSKANLSQKETLMTDNKNNITLEEETKVGSISSSEKAIPDEVTPKEKLLDVTVETRHTKSKAKFSEKPMLPDTITEDNIPTEQDRKMDNNSTLAEKQSVENIQPISDELTPKEELLDVAVETRLTKSKVKAKFIKKPTLTDASTKGNVPTEQETKTNIISSLTEKQLEENMPAIPDEVTPKEKVLDTLVETRRTKNKVKPTKKPTLTDSCNRDNMTFEKETKVDDNSLTENQTIEKVNQALPPEVTQLEKLLDLPVAKRQTKNKDNVVLEEETKVASISSLEKPIPNEVTSKKELLDVAIEKSETKNKTKAKFSKKPALADIVTKEVKIENISSLEEKQSLDNNMQVSPDKVTPKEKLLDMTEETKQIKSKLKANVTKKPTLADENKELPEQEAKIDNITSLTENQTIEDGKYAIPDKITQKEKVLDIPALADKIESKLLENDEITQNEELKDMPIKTIQSKNKTKSEDNTKTADKEPTLDKNSSPNEKDTDGITQADEPIEIVERKRKAKKIPSLTDSIYKEEQKTQIIDINQKKIKAKADTNKNLSISNDINKDNVPTESETKFQPLEIDTQTVIETVHGNKPKSDYSHRLTSDNLPIKKRKNKSESQENENTSIVSKTKDDSTNYISETISSEDSLTIVTDVIEEVVESKNITNCKKKLELTEKPIDKSSPLKETELTTPITKANDKTAEISEDTKELTIETQQSNSKYADRISDHKKKKLNDNKSHKVLEVPDDYKNDSSLKKDTESISEDVSIQKDFSERYNILTEMNKDEKIKTIVNVSSLTPKGNVEQENKQLSRKRKISESIEPTTIAAKKERLHSVIESESLKVPNSKIMLDEKTTSLTDSNEKSSSKGRKRKNIPRKTVSLSMDMDSSCSKLEEQLPKIQNKTEITNLLTKEKSESVQDKDISKKESVLEANNIPLLKDSKLIEIQHSIQKITEQRGTDGVLPLKHVLEYKEETSKQSQIEDKDLTPVINNVELKDLPKDTIIDKAEVIINNSVKKESVEDTIPSVDNKMDEMNSIQQNSKTECSVINVTEKKQVPTTPNMESEEFNKTIFASEENNKHKMHQMFEENTTKMDNAPVEDGNAMLESSEIERILDSVPFFNLSESTVQHSPDLRNIKKANKTLTGVHEQQSSSVYLDAFADHINDAKGASSVHLNKSNRTGQYPQIIRQNSESSNASGKVELLNTGFKTISHNIQEHLNQGSEVIMPQSLILNNEFKIPLKPNQKRKLSPEGHLSVTKRCKINTISDVYDSEPSTSGGIYLRKKDKRTIESVINQLKENSTWDIPDASYEEEVISTDDNQHSYSPSLEEITSSLIPLNDNNQDNHNQVLATEQAIAYEGLDTDISPNDFVDFFTKLFVTETTSFVVEKSSNLRAYPFSNPMSLHSWIPSSMGFTEQINHSTLSSNFRPKYRDVRSQQISIVSSHTISATITNNSLTENNLYSRSENMPNRDTRITSKKEITFNFNNHYNQGNNDYVGNVHEIAGSNNLALENHLPQGNHCASSSQPRAITDGTNDHNYSYYEGDPVLSCADKVDDNMSLNAKEFGNVILNFGDDNEFLDSSSLLDLDIHDENPARRESEPFPSWDNDSKVIVVTNEQYNNSNNTNTVVIPEDIVDNSVPDPWVHQGNQVQMFQEAIYPTPNSFDPSIGLTETITTPEICVAENSIKLDPNLGMYGTLSFTESVTTPSSNDADFNSSSNSNTELSCTQSEETNIETLNANSELLNQKQENGEVSTKNTGKSKRVEQQLALYKQLQAKKIVKQQCQSDTKSKNVEIPGRQYIRTCPGKWTKNSSPSGNSPVQRVPDMEKLNLKTPTNSDASKLYVKPEQDATLQTEIISINIPNQLEEPTIKDSTPVEAINDNTAKILNKETEKPVKIEEISTISNSKHNIIEKHGEINQSTSVDSQKIPQQCDDSTKAEVNINKDVAAFSNKTIQTPVQPEVIKTSEQLSKKVSFSTSPNVDKPIASDQKKPKEHKKVQKIVLSQKISKECDNSTKSEVNMNSDGLVEKKLTKSAVLTNKIIQTPVQPVETMTSEQLCKKVSFSSSPNIDKPTVSEQKKPKEYKKVQKIVSNQKISKECDNSTKSEVNMNSDGLVEKKLTKPAVLTNKIIHTPVQPVETKTSELLCKKVSFSSSPNIDKPTVNEQKKLKKHKKTEKIVSSHGLEKEKSPQIKHTSQIDNKNETVMFCDKISGNVYKILRVPKENSESSRFIVSEHTMDIPGANPSRESSKMLPASRSSNDLERSRGTVPKRKSEILHNKSSSERFHNKVVPNIYDVVKSGRRAEVTRTYQERPSSSTSTSTGRGYSVNDILGKTRETREPYKDVRKSYDPAYKRSSGHDSSKSKVQKSHKNTEDTFDHLINQGNINPCFKHTSNEAISSNLIHRVLRKDQRNMNNMQQKRHPTKAIGLSDEKKNELLEDLRNIVQMQLNKSTKSHSDGDWRQEIGPLISDNLHGMRKND